MEQKDVLQIQQDAKHTADILLDQLDQKWEYLRQAVKDVTETVGEIPVCVERCRSDQRFGELCNGLEKLEKYKRRLDERFSAYLGMDLLIADANMKLLGWEGELTLSHALSNAATDQVRNHRMRLQCAAETYAKKRDWAGNFTRAVFPHFLKELYRLSDGERDGQGFRMQSVAALCGGFCNGVKIP